MKIIKFALFSLILSSCSQKDPNPELADVIYKDLVIELDIAKKAEEDEEEKNLHNLLKEKLLAVPQTGQIKFANKKQADSEEKLNILRQHRQFFEISLAQRAALAKNRYDESLRPGGKPWPDKEEVALYASVVKFQRDKLLWEKNKGNLKYVPRRTDKK